MLNTSVNKQRLKPQTHISSSLFPHVIVNIHLKQTLRFFLFTVQKSESSLLLFNALFLRIFITQSPLFCFT